MTDTIDAPSASDTARILLEVVAGILPGEPIATYTRQWAITTGEWRQATEDNKVGEVLASANGKAQGYAGLLMLQPDAVNWVQTTWIWL